MASGGIIQTMKSKFVFLALVSILVLFLCLCLRNINAETWDNEKDFILEAFDLPVQVSFDYYVSIFACFIIAFAFVLLPQQFLIQYIGRHENSPPRISPFIVF